MGVDTTLLFSARDEISPALNGMCSNIQRFNKDAEQTEQRIGALQKKQESLRETYSKTQTELFKLSEELKKAKKEYANLNNETNKTNLDKAFEKYNKTKDSLKDVSDEARRTRNSIRNLSDEANKTNLDKSSEEYNKTKTLLRDVGDEARRTQNSIRDLSSEQSKSENKALINTSGGESGILTALAGAGLGKMVAGSLGNALNTGISSAFGDSVGSSISGIVSGALSGAAMGSIAGPIGTAAGAAVGVVAGGIDAAITRFEKKEDIFKAERERLVDIGTSTYNNDRFAGMDIQSGREITEIAFGTLMGGKDEAAAYLDRVRQMDKDTPFNYDDLVSLSKTLLARGVTDQDTLLKQMIRVGDTGAALGLSQQDMETIGDTLGYMNQQGEMGITKRMTDILQLRGIKVYEYLAEAYEATVPEIMKMISDGAISGEIASEVISRYMGYEFKGMMDEQSATYSGIVSAHEGEMDDVYAMAAKGFQDTRSGGIMDEIDWLSSDMGDQWKELKYNVGVWEAEQENRKEQLRRDIISAVMSNSVEDLPISDLADNQRERLDELALKLKEAIENDDKSAQGEVMAMLEIQAEIAYSVSDEADKHKDMMESIIEQTSKTLAGDPRTWEAGYIVGEAWSKGLLDAMPTANAITDRLSRNSYLKNPQQPDLSYNGDISGVIIDPFGSANLPDAVKNFSGNAYGKPYVPYDNYIARLHEGEEVLTAQQARQRREGTQAAPIITGNNFNIREEADIYKIAQVIASELRKASMISY